MPICIRNASKFDLDTYICIGRRGFWDRGPGDYFVNPHAHVCTYEVEESDLYSRFTKYLPRDFYGFVIDSDE